MKINFPPCLSSLIKFSIESALTEELIVINIINKTGTVNMIKESYYIDERRWDVKLKNDIILNLSEINIEESLNNYIKLIKKLNNSDVITINSIDLRDSEKAIIRFK